MSGALGKLAEYVGNHPVVGLGALQAGGSFLTGLTNSVTTRPSGEAQRPSGAKQAAANLLTLQTQNLAMPKSVASSAPVTGSPAPLVPQAGLINQPPPAPRVTGSSMSGIIIAQPSDSTPDQQSSDLNNPLRRTAGQEIESNIVDPGVHSDFLKIVLDGLHIAFANEANGFMAKLPNSRDPIGDSARGAVAVALLLIVPCESKGVMPMKAGIPAGMVLMLHGLDFIDRSGIANIAEPELDSATKTFINELFHRLRITPAMLQHVAGRVHEITQEPTAMQAINLEAGIVKHPMAPEPTPLPPSPGAPPP